MTIHHLSALGNTPLTSNKALIPFITMITVTNKITYHTEPNLQLSVSTKISDHMAELLEATRKMAKYFKRSYKHSRCHPCDNSNCHRSTNHYNNSHPDRHKCQPCNNNDEVNKIINQTCTSNNTPSVPKNSKAHHDSDSSDSILDSSSHLE